MTTRRSRPSSSGSGPPETEASGRHRTQTVILGLDLSLTGTGAVVWNGKDVLGHDLISTPAGMVDEERYHIIWRRIFRLWKRHQPAMCAVEQAIGGARTDSRTHALNGVVRYQLFRQEALLVVTHPNSIKKFATGNGRASKDEMLSAARNLWPDCPEHNCADAFWLADEALSIAPW